MLEKKTTFILVNYVGFSCLYCHINKNFFLQVYSFFLIEYVSLFPLSQDFSHWQMFTLSYYFYKVDKKLRYTPETIIIAIFLWFNTQESQITYNVQWMIKTSSYRYLILISNCLH